MSSSTDNLGMTLPAESERLSLGVLNQNWGIVEDFAGLCMIDYGSKTVSAFQDALSTTMSDIKNGQTVSFTVNFTDSVSPMSSGAHTGVATRNSSTRFNVILQRSGSDSNENYLGSLTSNGWSWDKVATKSQIDAINSQIAAINIFPNGTRIPDNSDVNSYMTPGKYYSPSTTTTSTMSNAPVAGGFSLLVVINGADWVNQYATPVNGSQIKHRYYTASNSTWSAWHTLSFA